MGSGALIVGLLGLAFLVYWLGTRKPRNGPTQPKGNQALAKRAAAPRSPRRQREAGSPSTKDDTGAPARQPPETLRRFQLLRSEDLDEAGILRIEAISSSMPDPHPIQARIAGGLDSPDELKEAVVSDPGLTASILRTVNSAAFALASPITSIQHAITYLGVNVVKGLVTQAALAERSAEGTPEQQATLRRIWRSAYIASAATQAIAQEIGLARPSVVATHTLFFNLGDVVFTLGIEGAPDWYNEGSTLFERIEAQQDSYGANTAIVGAALARHWALPQDLSLALEDALLPLSTPPDKHPLSGDALRQNVVVYLGGQIGDWMSYRGLENVSDLPLDDANDPGLFYLREYLEAAGMTRVTDLLLQDAGFRRKLNRVATALT